jgi:hypothetical protein
MHTTIAIWFIVGAGASFAVVVLKRRIEVWLDE